MIIDYKVKQHSMVLCFAPGQFASQVQTKGRLKVEFNQIRGLPLSHYGIWAKKLKWTWEKVIKIMEGEYKLGNNINVKFWRH